MSNGKLRKQLDLDTSLLDDQLTAPTNASYKNSITQIACMSKRYRKDMFQTCMLSEYVLHYCTYSLTVFVLIAVFFLQDLYL